MNRAEGYGMRLLIVGMSLMVGMVAAGVSRGLLENVIAAFEAVAR